jgi:hypothetical protein
LHVFLINSTAGWAWGWGCIIHDIFIIFSAFREINHTAQSPLETATDYGRLRLMLDEEFMLHRAVEILISRK